MNKYRNRKTTLFGITFDSQREAQRYLVLRADLEAGSIKDLQLQVPYEIKINGVKVCKYVADFVYQKDGKTITEDSKGMKTQVYILKRKLMKAVHGIDIVEV